MFPDPAPRGPGRRTPTTDDTRARRAPTRGAAAPGPELLALPAPRLLHEALTGSRHLHLGYFEGAQDDLGEALDRLVTRDMRLLPREALVADVGCGLGGTVSLLAAQGHRAYGIDPCTRSIAYARTLPPSSRAQFFACDFAQFTARARGARFDALFLVEVLPHFPDLPALLADCRAILRPGGLLFLHDVLRAPGHDPAGRAWPSQEALRNACGTAGFDRIESREVGPRTSPTLSRLARLLAERRDELVAAFASERPEIGREIDDYERELRAQELAFARQELRFESSVLRCSTRFGSDSVVLRPRARASVRAAVRKRPS